MNAWLEQTGDYEGLGVWAWYYCYRALVRAKVACLRRRQSDVSTDEAQRLDSQLTDYLQLALAITHRPRPRLIITQGVSGSGKSYSAQRLAADFGLIRIRSDVERKRMFGQGNEPAQKIGALYGTEATEQTYLRLRNLAADIMRSGWSVIVDATFLRRSQREPFRDLAKSLDVECCVLAFHADRSILEERIQQRQRAGADPSDATVEVLAGQLQRIENVEPSEGWTVLPVETGQPDSSEHLASAFNVWVNSRVS